MDYDFHSEFMGQTARQDFRVICLWELDAHAAIALNNPVLLPFVPLMKEGTNSYTLRKCVEQIRKEPNAEELEVMLAAFANLVMDAEVIRHMVRWNMHILRGAPILQEIFAEYDEMVNQLEAEREKLKMEREEIDSERKEIDSERKEIDSERKEIDSEREGMRNTLLNNLRLILFFRFNIPSDYIDKYLRPLNLAKLRQLAELSGQVETLEEFETYLPKPKPLNGKSNGSTS